MNAEDLVFLFFSLFLVIFVALLISYYYKTTKTQKKQQEFLEAHSDKLSDDLPEDNPVEKKDENNRLHSIDGPAREYSDGRKEYFVHGISFSKDMFTNIFIKRNYTPERILNMKNAEQKGVVIKIVGYDYIISELKDFELLDEESVKSKVTGEPLLYQVIEFNITNTIVVRLVKVQDHTTGKITCLGVPRIPQTRTCMGAIAWTFNLDTWNYEPEVET